MNNYPYNNPYNPYGYNPQQYQQQYLKMQKNQQDKREFRKRCTLVALGVVLFVVLSFATSFVVLKTEKLYNLYLNNVSFSLSADIIITVISMFGAYLIARLLIDKNHHAFIPLCAPANKKHAALLIPVGLLSCVAGGYATYVMNSVIENGFGVTFTQPEITDPKSPSELVLYLVCSALVPCIFEEIALRAGALEAMRKYGDWFAIISSSFIFAILHGNMIQTPFAFIAGIAIGYVYVATGSIWPGVIIHFVNNLASCSTEIGEVFGFDSASVETAYSIYVGIVVIVGLICLILFLTDRNKPKLNKDVSTLSVSQKIGGFILNAPMIASILYMGYITSLYIEWNQI
jgi:membrane protease YdiL (CAAX protease family)